MTRISHSELVVHDSCKRSWMLKYKYGFRLRPEEDAPVKPRHLGFLFHKCLEHVYFPGKVPDPLPIFREEAGMYDDETSIKALKTANTAAAMLERYRLWLETPDEEGRRPDDWLRFDEPESRMTLPAQVDEPGKSNARRVFGPPFPKEFAIIGYVDITGRDTYHDMPVIIEHKTTRLTQETWVGGELQALKWQVLLYSIMYRELTGELPDVIFNVIRSIENTARSKPPFEWRHRIRFSEPQIEAGRLAIAHRARSILESHRKDYVPPSHGRPCDRCDFTLICPSFDDGTSPANLQAMLNEVYESREEREKRWAEQVQDIVVT